MAFAVLGFAASFVGSSAAHGFITSSRPDFTAIGPRMLEYGRQAAPFMPEGISQTAMELWDECGGPCEPGYNGRNMQYHGQYSPYNSGRYNYGRSNYGRYNDGSYYNNGYIQNQYSPYNNGRSNYGRSNYGRYSDGGYYNNGYMQNDYSPYKNGRSNYGRYNNGRYNDGGYYNMQNQYNSGRYMSSPYNNGPYNNGPYDDRATTRLGLAGRHGDSPFGDY